jgi:hypothetical protein
MEQWLRRHGVLLALLVLAIVCYGIGYRKGSVVALVLGVLFEIGFWLGFWKRR